MTDLFCKNCKSQQEVQPITIISNIEIKCLKCRSVILRKWNNDKANRWWIDNIEQVPTGFSGAYKYKEGR